MIKIHVSDAALISAYIQGDDKAFETLVKRSKSKVFTSIYLIVKDRYVAEDLLQETYIKAIDVIKSGRYNEEGKFLPWVARIAHNLAIDFFRKEKRYPTIVLEDGSKVFNSFDFAEDSAEDLQMKSDQIANVRWIMQRSSEYNQDVFLCFIDYSKAFDCVDHPQLWNTLRAMGFPEHPTVLQHNLYDNQRQ
jgi:RNA polymerase sigma-70 factor (ECF subfamily)